MLSDTTGAAGPGSLWPAFAPELILCGTIVAMLLFRVLGLHRRISALAVALAGTCAALYFACPAPLLGDATVLEPRELFTGMLVLDGFSVFMRSLLLVFVALLIVLTGVSKMPERDDRADFYVLLLGATLGMCLMASANHLLVVFLAVEMASVPSYVMAGMVKSHRQSSEAALKYSVFGAGAAGVMLYGISLLAGLFNTAHLPTLAVRMGEYMASITTEQGALALSQETMVLVLGGLMFAVGLAFKLSAVPFHFWCPDVFEGASAEVNAFLSVASKAAALALLVRVAIGLGTVPDERLTPASPVALVATEEAETGNTADAQKIVVPAVDPERRAELNEALAPVRHFTGLLIALLAVVTCTFGNLVAYAQTNIKRLMAYSTIAHAGYMMMAVPAALELAGSDTAAAEAAIAALAIYVAIYLFMNLGAFAVVAVLRDGLGSEQIADWAGLLRRCPILVICFALMLFGLLGIPPLAGFIGKFAVFAALIDGYGRTGQLYLLLLVVVGGLNTVVSLFYYLRVVKTMAVDEPPERPLPCSYKDGSPQGFYIMAVTVPTVALFVWWEKLSEWASLATDRLF